MIAQPTTDRGLVESRASGTPETWSEAHLGAGSPPEEHLTNGDRNEERERHGDDRIGNGQMADGERPDDAAATSSWGRLQNHLVEVNSALLTNAVSEGTNLLFSSS